jgi:hypothetical protein
VNQIIYVLTLKTWDDPPAHHTYGRIHWTAPDPCDHSGIISKDFAEWCEVCGADYSQSGQQAADSLAEPDAEGFSTSRHETRQSAIDGARRWFSLHATANDVLLIGTWTLCGWDPESPFEVLEGCLRAS